MTGVRVIDFLDLELGRMIGGLCVKLVRLCFELRTRKIFVTTTKVNGWELKNLNTTALDPVQRTLVYLYSGIVALQKILTIPVVVKVSMFHTTIYSSWNENFLKVKLNSRYLKFDGYLLWLFTFFE
jgi:hypothetical protein